MLITKVQNRHTESCISPILSSRHPEQPPLDKPVLRCHRSAPGPRVPACAVPASTCKTHTVASRRAIGWDRITWCLEKKKKKKWKLIFYDIRRMYVQDTHHGQQACHWLRSYHVMSASKITSPPHLSLNREELWGIADDFTTSFVQFSPFCTAFCDRWTEASKTLISYGFPQNARARHIQWPTGVSLAATLSRDVCKQIGTSNGVGRMHTHGMSTAT